MIRLGDWVRILTLVARILVLIVLLVFAISGFLFTAFVVVIGAADVTGKMGNIRESEQNNVYYYEPLPRVIADLSCVEKRGAATLFLLQRLAEYKPAGGIGRLVIQEGELNCSLAAIIAVNAQRDRSGETETPWVESAVMDLSRRRLSVHLVYRIPFYSKVKEDFRVPPERISYRVDLTPTLQPGRPALRPEGIRRGQLPCLFGKDGGTCLDWMTYDEAKSALTGPWGSLGWIWEGYRFPPNVSQFFLEENYILVEFSHRSQAG